ncbi:MAG: endonuclease/exonuclease/phosphatase family protein [Flavobacteriaceae bacterium]|nr:endonuclease/exonuclease/phosphatase family protein [Flavobacteriaceae bacterium]
MKKLSFLDTLIYLINTVLATILLLSYIVPYISPTSLPSTAIIGLAVPFLIIFNALFLLYWLIKLKKQLLISAVVLAIGWFASPSFYEFSDKQTPLNTDLKVMSYNVRMFNHYKWNSDKQLAQKTFDFIQKKSPDILALQEFYQSPNISFTYPYKYIKTKSKRNKFGLAIYSKYQILNAGSLDFNNSANNIIFADILIKKDTIRVYNIHLESLKINPKKEYFGEENNEKLLGRLQSTFQKQALQTQQFLAHEKQWKGKKIVLGDFNNTSFSWVYRNIRKNKKDAFLIAGKGFGKTFDYPFPLRIDFIFTDTSIEINSFKRYNEKFSDHYPILARLNWE